MLKLNQITSLKPRSLIWLFVVGCLTFGPVAQAQFSSGYEDYDSFSANPADLDREVSDLFGRFFQTQGVLGTHILTGDLGQAYSAGLMLGAKFIFFFDKVWAGELGGSWARHTGVYNSTNTETKGIDIEQKMTLIPVSLGLRYAFDPDNLTRGFSAMNPYVSAAAVYVFRSEEVVGSPTTTGISNTSLKAKFIEGQINSSRGFGTNLGGGVEFDVYDRKLYLGLDLRYHFYFWSDADVLIGKLGRRGNGVSIAGTFSYNY
jgi:hypothetical protein